MEAREGAGIMVPGHETPRPARGFSVVTVAHFLDDPRAYLARLM
jgi:hypothetical protein